MTAQLMKQVYAGILLAWVVALPACAGTPQPCEAGYLLKKLGSNESFYNQIEVERLLF